jgi:branched-chain amino acid transport system substrate-binding protein
MGVEVGAATLDCGTPAPQAEEKPEENMSARLLAALIAFLSSVAWAAPPPAEIKLGTLYASSGNYAGVSSAMHAGLKIWIDQKNAEGGVFVKPFNKKIPIKLIAYDDQSNTATAATLYSQLITQDKVDILAADFGSVLTSVAVPIARDHKMLLIDQTGSGAAFFTKDNPYIVLTSLPMSSVWPKHMIDFLLNEGPKLGIKRVALLYATNDFHGTQAAALRDAIKAAGGPVQLVYDNGVPTNTSSYTVTLNAIAATKPDAVVAMGYVNNDIAFLRNLQDSGLAFKWLFTIYPGLETEAVEKNVGAKGLEHIFTYVPSSVMEYKPEFGMSLKEFRAVWDKRYGDGHIEFGFNAVAGYTTGLVLEKALAATDSMDQLALRKAIVGLSGKLRTIDGTFEIDDGTGAQIGETQPLGQIELDEHGHVKFVTIHPAELATGKPVLQTP